MAVNEIERRYFRTVMNAMCWAMGAAGRCSRSFVTDCTAKMKTAKLSNPSAG